MFPVRPEMQKAGPSTSVTVPLVPRDGLADDVQGLVMGRHAIGGTPPKAPGSGEFPLPA